MRVLWVEDFGAEAEDLIDQIFSGLLSDDYRQRLAELQSRQGKSRRPQGYDAWRNWHREQSLSDEPEIDVYCRSRDFDAIVGSGYLVDRYDAVLLDVNLELDFFDAAAMVGTSRPDPQKGGFWLYNKLVRAGFPSSRIALLTAHDKEAATSEFLRVCQEYGHEKLLAFGKSNRAVGDWIKNLSSDHDGFLQLRRGVLDSIEFAEDRLPNGQLEIRFNDYLAPEEWSIDQALNYLCTMRYLMPVRVTATERQNQLRGFRYLLGCEWEDRAKPGKAKDRTDKSLGWVMKNLRNWSSHGHLLDDASVGQISFLSLASMRTAFRFPVALDAEWRRLEYRLLAAMGKPQPIDLPGLAISLSMSYLRVRRILVEKTRKGEWSTKKIKDGQGRVQPGLVEDQQDFRSIVNELAIAQDPPTPFDFPSALCEIFIHATLYLDGLPAKGEWNDTADNNAAIERAYHDALQKRYQKLPVWVSDIWCRFRIV